MNKFCIVIPVYNHHHKLAQLLTAINQYDLPVFLIDDGSEPSSQAQIKQIANQFKNVELSQFIENKGKGAAVMAGMQLAYEKGFTHGLQIDADYQHDMQDISLFLERAKQHPKAIICGIPRYDESVNKKRYYARYLTHVWVWINTLSLDIKDSMCGYRAYPLASFMAQINRKKPGRRMSFDTDIIVRLFWRGIEVINVPTKVIYHQDVPSNFRMWADNWQITKMHATLFFGMLIRSPWLIARKFKS